MNNKPKLIFIEGAQATGKSSITKELREKLKYTTMLDLSAIGDKSFEGRDKMHKYHKSILEMIENCKKYILKIRLFWEFVTCLSCPIW